MNKNPFTVSSINNNNFNNGYKPSDYDKGNTFIPGLRDRTISLWKPIGESLYNNRVANREEEKHREKDKEEGNSEEDKEEDNSEEDKEDIILVKKPPKETFTQSLKKWLTPRKGGKKNKKLTKNMRSTKYMRSKKRRSSRK